jgi:hypothetical protein
LAKTPPVRSDFEEMFSLGEGYKTTIQKVRRVDPSDTSWDDVSPLIRDSIEIEAKIHDGTGKEVGFVKRNFNVKDGKKVVYQNEFILEEDQQGKGLGKTFVRRSLEGYRKAGIDQAHMNACFIGRYTWPRMGFDVEKEELEAIKKKFGNYLVKEVGMSSEASASLVANLRTMRDLVSVRVENQHVGKSFLLDGHDDMVLSFHAHLNIDPNDEGFKTVQEYVK